jgi:hypothetical protein
MPQADWSSPSLFAIRSISVPHVRYGVRAPTRTTTAITMSPKATDARRVITLAVGLMVSSIESGWVPQPRQQW